MRKKRIYLDYAASTPVAPKVLSAMTPFFAQDFANPLSLHAEGQKAQRAVQGARVSIARGLGVRDSELYFTASGTESNNLALQGVIEAHREKIDGKPHIICTSIEHASVKKTVLNLEENGCEVTFLPVSEKGIISVEDLTNAITPQTVLVTCIYVNNEIGSIQPLHKIGNILDTYKKQAGRESSSYPYLHSDASQAPRVLSIFPHGLKVDLMTIDGQKIYGPKGVGLLYKRECVPCSPQTFGGAQEAGLRAGTENVSAIVGIAKALEICKQDHETEYDRLKILRDQFFTFANEALSGIVWNSDKEGVPHILNFSLEDISGERLVIELDIEGFGVSSGSACLSGADDYSYVVEALGGENFLKTNSLRISLGRDTKKVQLEKIIKAIQSIIQRNEEKLAIVNRK